MMEILNNRKIKISSQSDKLRWGCRPTGRFTLKEAYYLATHHSNIQDDRFWGKFGRLIYGLKYTPFSGRLLTKKSSLGIVSLSEAFMIQGYACYVSKKKNPWNISSILVPSATLYGIREPSHLSNIITTQIPSDLPPPLGGITALEIPF
jgi:hypothetical protein